MNSARFVHTKWIPKFQNNFENNENSIKINIFKIFVDY